MAELLLFHHAQGLTPGIHDLADRIRSSGHTVHTPDLYGGRVFDHLDDGLAYAADVGFAALAARGVAAALERPQEIAYAGSSLGAMPAQQLAQTRPGCTAAILLHACLPVSEFGARWPATVPVQVHGMEADPFFADEGDLEAARELVRTTPDAELFTYPGKAHLFTDSSLPDYDPEATAQVLERVVALLDRSTPAGLTP